MIHSFIITSDRGHVLYSQHFGDASEEDRLVFERDLFVHTRALWSAAAVAPQITLLRGRYVVVKAVNDLVLLIAGSEEHDELALEEVLTTIVDALKADCTNRLAAADLADSNTFGKMCVLVGEVLLQGEVLHLDRTTILRMSKLKPPPDR